MGQPARRLLSNNGRAIHMPKKIMVVDDDAQVRLLVRLILERKGYQVIEANDGMSALFSLETLTPDLLILDIMMPGMDGFELCRRVRSRPETALTPVIMFSASDNQKVSYSSLESGADEYMPKTSPPLVLARRVEQLLGVSPIQVQ
jgi:DNA-binding response OmpR family regulator